MKRLAILLLLCCSLFAQNPPQPPQEENEPEFVKQADQLMRDGRTQEALAVYQNELKTTPTSTEAAIGAGAILDLMLRGPEARQYFDKAIANAQDEESRNSANRAMAMSWAFDRNCQMTVMYEQKVLDAAKAKNDLTRAAEVANEEARVCLEAGDFQNAEVWYKEGHELAMKQPNLTDAQKDLWNFRWEHAEARIAVRVNEGEDPQKHIAAAKAILDKGNIDQQKPFLPYLTGYVAFYEKDYKKAVENLQQANQKDPFIQCLLAQSYEALGQKDQATDLYKKAAAATGHNAATAYAVPFAKKKLGEK